MDGLLELSLLYHYDFYLLRMQVGNVFIVSVCVPICVSICQAILFEWVDIETSPQGQGFSKVKLISLNLNLAGS